MALFRERHKGFVVLPYCSVCSAYGSVLHRAHQADAKLIKKIEIPVVCGHGAVFLLLKICEIGRICG